MIDVLNVRENLKEYLNSYENKTQSGYNLKVVHTYHVAENAKIIAQNLNLDEEDIKLAEVIGLLHDIGRFEELKIIQGFNSVKFDHAMHGSKMLFEQGMIRKFLNDDKYDYIIKKAIENHSKLKIEDGLDKRTLLHAKIIRDADKIDNFRVKKEDKIEDLFPSQINNINEIEESLISPKVYQSILDRNNVDIHERITPLDNIICVLAFIFDLNFKISFKMIRDKNFINLIIDRFNFKNHDTKLKMENIRDILNKYIDEKLILENKYNIKIIGDSLAVGVRSF